MNMCEPLGFGLAATAFAQIWCFGMWLWYRKGR